MAALSSAPSGTQTATVTVDRWWLKNPLNSAQNTTVEVVTPFRTDRPEPQTVYRPLGRNRPVVTAGTMQGEEGELILECWTQAEYDAVTTIRSSQQVLLLQSPFEQQWYVRLGASRRTEFTFAAGTTRARTVQVSFVEVDRP